MFFNTSQKLKNRVGWLDERHGLSPILYDTAPLFVCTRGRQPTARVSHLARQAIRNGTQKLYVLHIEFGMIHT